LLQALLGHDSGLVPLTQLLIARTQGNPFFLEESVRTLVETGALVGERGAYHPEKPLNTLQVPATVQALLAARIDRLQEGAQVKLSAAIALYRTMEMTFWLRHPRPSSMSSASLNAIRIRPIMWAGGLGQNQ
jgi:predicted ATPase